jgi:hypothetical protein
MAQIVLQRKCAVATRAWREICILSFAYDLAAADWENGSVDTYLGNGDGTFGAINRRKRQRHISSTGARRPGLTRHSQPRPSEIFSRLDVSS